MQAHRDHMDQGERHGMQRARRSDALAADANEAPDEE